MRHLLISFAFSLMSTPLLAQDHLGTSGGDLDGSNGSASYTIGQIDYESYSSSSGSVNEGVQQPLEFYTAIDDVQSTEIEASVYPNPFEDQFKLELEEQPKEARYQIYDIGGKLLMDSRLSKRNTVISTQDLSSGEYVFVVLIDGQKRSWKMLKP